MKDERYLGAEVGLLASLHTWGRTGSFHPHVDMFRRVVAYTLASGGR